MVGWQAKGVEPQRGKYRYVVKDGASGPWLAAEPYGNPIKIVGSKGRDLQIGFGLQPRTTPEQAQRIAMLMSAGSLTFS
jgi:hypothetical protein